MLIGAILGWLFGKTSMAAQVQAAKADGQNSCNELEKQLVEYRATKTAELQALHAELQKAGSQLRDLQEIIHERDDQVLALNGQLSTAIANLEAANQTVAGKNDDLAKLKDDLDDITAKHMTGNQLLATANANNAALQEKLETQKKEMEELGRKFNTEFENIANRILDTKTEKFTELNKTNLNFILEPLGKNLSEFKTKVEEVYDKESKERFSLGEKVKELAELNKLISEEANNLTKALKGEAKTQGRWGEMILESILEKSGLEKGREYFMEHELRDTNGNPLKSDSEGKKMRPDAVIKYPDNRSVIIDSKVSLNAFTRFVESTDAEAQQQELDEHVKAIRSHIVALSAKGYDDYQQALDFVMMFIPSEAAYMAALKADAGLWNFAYDKRILLISPTNLITSLKLIVDLWKREYQNQNALEIAERGAKLYDKFVGFVSNLKDVGKHLESAQGKYAEAYKQLATGNDNLVLQSEKLKNLGLKTKKDLPKEIVEMAVSVPLLDDRGN